MSERFETPQFSVALNSATLPALSLEEFLSAAADAGFDGVGLWTKDVVPSGEVTNVSVGDLSAAGELAAAQAQKYGLHIAEFCSLLCATSAEMTFESVLSHAEKLLLLTASLGCPTLVAVPALVESQADLSVSQWREVAAAARSAGVRIALEFPATAKEITRLGAARRLVGEVAERALGVLVDTFHCFVGGTDANSIENLPIHDLALVHVSDAEMAPRERLLEYHDHRTFTGSGQIDFAPFVKLIERGYKDWVSIEIWNQKLPKSAPPDEIASRAMAGVKSVFG